MRWNGRAVRVLCCALLALAVVSRSAAQDGDAAPSDVEQDVDAQQDADVEEDVEVEEDEEAEVEDECVEQPLGWLARRGLVSHLTESYPWITEPILEETLVTCEDDEETQVEVSFEPHLRGPRSERFWTLPCERIGLSWSCAYPEEQTFVYLASGDAGVPIARDVPPDEALEALAAIVIQSEGPSGIPDPFDPDDPYLDLTVDSMLAVTREEICAGLLVAVQLEPAAPRNQFCVERAACGASSRPCPWTVRVEGATE